MPFPKRCQQSDPKKVFLLMLSANESAVHIEGDDVLLLWMSEAVSCLYETDVVFKTLSPNRIARLFVLPHAIH
jgi:hypothetical protein